MRHKYYYDEWFIKRDAANKKRCVYAYNKNSKHMQACKDDSMLNQQFGCQWYRVAYKVMCSE
jgi:hypothetical protein